MTTRQRRRHKAVNAMPKPTTKRTVRAQGRRFIEAAREHGASEDEAVFDENLKQIAQAKPSEKQHQKK